MSQKILMINGSPRKKGTYNVLLSIGEVLKKHGMEYEIIHLYDYNINCCSGCDVTCINNGQCNTAKRTNDDMPSLMQKIMECDGIVFATPVYINGVTAKFKSFVDRTNTWVHNPGPFGKPVLNVATTASTGLKDTARFLNLFAVGFGARIGGFIGRKNSNIDKPVTEKEMGKFLKYVKSDKRKYAPKAKEIIMFLVQRTLATKFGGGNKEYWENQQLLARKYYYYDCKISIFKKLLAKLMAKILNKAIKV